MGAFIPFTPNSAGTVNLAVTGTTGRVPLSKTGVSQQIMVTHGDSVTNVAAIGTSSTTLYFTSGQGA